LEPCQEIAEKPTLAFNLEAEGDEILISF